MKKRYYSLYQDAENKKAEIYIYGDITSYDWREKDKSSYTLVKELEELEDVEEIKIFINSYGGEVKEGLAIYNALKRHKAKIKTYVDGFACSIASVIFAAGDERIMSNTSLLMIHNAWTWVAGDSNELKKQAEDLEKITQASINVYLNITNLSEEEIKEMMDEETWIGSDEAFEMGFATEILELEEKEVATQSIRKRLFQKITKEPEKIPIASIRFDKEELEEIVQRQIAQLEKKIIPNGKIKPQDPQQKDNKLSNFMKAFFNVKNEEEY